MPAPQLPLTKEPGWRPDKLCLFIGVTTLNLIRRSTQDLVAAKSSTVCDFAKALIADSMSQGRG